MARHSPPRMGRFIFRMLIALLLVSLILTVAGALLWQQFKRDLGIRQLDWQGPGLSLGHLSLERLTLAREDAAGSLIAQVNGLRLDWRLAGGPYWQAMRADSLNVDWHPGDSDSQSGAPTLPISRPDPRELLPDWLPRTLRVERFDLTLPCADGRCTLTGQLALQQGGATDAPANLELALAHQGRTLRVDAQVSGPAERVDLSARARIDEHTRLSLTSIYREQPGAGAWSGQLELPALPEAPWLLAWLEHWSGSQPHLQNAGELQARADWDWQLTPGPLDAAQLRTLSGHLNLDATLPTPWPLPGVGQVQGNATLQLRAEEGRWHANRLQADLRLQQLEPGVLAALPAGLRPSDAHLQVRQRDLPTTPSGELPLQLQLDTRGALHLDVQADVQLKPAPRDWSLQVDSSRIRASAARLHMPALDARALRLDMQLNGRLDARSFAFELDKASSLVADELLIPGDEPIRLTKPRLDRTALSVSGTLPASEPPGYQISGPARLRIEQLQHSALHPLEWSWEGLLNATGQGQQLAGTVGNGAGLSARLEIRRTAASLEIDTTLPDSFLRGGNPLAATLSAWPAALELGTGRLQLDANLSLPTQGPLKARAALQLKGIGGLYDRTEFSGLDARLNGGIEDHQLRLEIAELKLQNVNPGVLMGPLRFDGEYRAALAQPTGGRLSWSTARSALLGGEVWLEPGNLSLAQTTVLPVQIRGLTLQELFRAYPAEGLSGRGTLDGELPLGVGPDGVWIVNGHLAARAPGGQLQFNSPKISALGRSNPTMQVVADALEDFHYDLLSSGVDYDAQGTLRLALKLEGRNPDVERGRPINFSINLEEDIPALLTSLQLTGRVSDRVRERVQQHMEQSRSTP